MRWMGGMVFIGDEFEKVCDVLFICRSLFGNEGVGTVKEFG